MKKIKIAIVDSGVFLEHPLIQNCANGFTIRGKGTIDDFGDQNGHGTAIYEIINNSQIPVEIINIKIQGIENGVEEKELIYALEYIYDKMNVNIINLSLGLSIVENKYKLEDICKRLYKKGVIIIAAFDNTGCYSYPAVFDCVIGVTSSKFCRNKEEFEYYKDKKVNIGAFGNVQRLAWKEPKFIISAGNSFACAHVTVQCAKYLLSGITSFDEILANFESDAKLVYDVDIERHQSEMQVDKAIIFPFNKEMHSLIRYSDMLDFEIVDVYDLKYSGRVGSYTTHILKNEYILKKKIKSIENIEFETFDTLILGHMDEMAYSIHNMDIKEEIVSMALDNGKKVYAFDDLSNIVKRKSADVYWPEVTIKDVPGSPQGKLYRISKPVLGVFGTSSKQGKFTLQLALRKKLQHKGVKVGQIGTEPSSLLYGFDVVYPMGYNGNVHLSSFDAIRYLNYQINQLCEKENDIIIVGSQSGTVSYDVGNLGQYNMLQYDFLQGTLPDAVILCVNTYDSIQHIERTVQFIQSATESVVIALVIFPVILKNESLGLYGGTTMLTCEKFEFIKEVFETEIGIPTFNLDFDEDLEKIVEIILNYFR